MASTRARAAADVPEGRVTRSQAAQQPAPGGKRGGADDDVAKVRAAASKSTLGFGFGGLRFAASPEPAAARTAHRSGKLARGARACAARSAQRAARRRACAELSVSSQAVCGSGGRRAAGAKKRAALCDLTNGGAAALRLGAGRAKVRWSFGSNRLARPRLRAARASARSPAAARRFRLALATGWRAHAAPSARTARPHDQNQLSPAWLSGAA